MTEAYDGPQVVGVDLHRRRSVLVRMTADGRYRIKLVRMRSAGKEQVDAVLAKLGIAVICPDLSGAWGPAWLDGLALARRYAGKVALLRELAGWLPAGTACWMG